MSADAQGGNDYIIDAENPAEMARLINFDRITTEAMGGVLAEQSTSIISGMNHILDLGCGPGGWVLDVAFAYPTIEVAGIDISQQMIKYANARAQAQGLNNAFFEVMDITKPLDFSDSSFDLVNARFLINVFHKDNWPKLMKESMRILKAGGILRWTESDAFGLTNSPAYERLVGLALEAEWRAGYTFSPNGRTNGITPVIGRMMSKAGCQNIQQKPHMINFSAGTEAWMSMYDNTKVVGELLAPFLLKLGVIAKEEMEQLAEQVLVEMQSEEFCGVWYYMTTWGSKP